MTRKRKWFFGATAVVALVSVAVLLGTRLYISDYGSGAKVLVVDPAGKPISGAEVTIIFDSTVYEAITPIQRVRATTDNQGRLRQFFISCGKPGGGYTIIVEKAGYRSVQLHGSGMGSHRVVLRHAEQSS